MEGKRLLALAVVILLQLGVQAQTARGTSAQLSTPKTERNADVAVTVTEPPRGAKTAQVMIDNRPPLEKPVTDGTVHFTVPPDLPLGTYSIRVNIAGTLFYAGQLAVVRELGAEPELTSIEPSVIYRPGRAVSLTLLGKNFSLQDGENTVLLNDAAQSAVWGGCNPSEESAEQRAKIHGKVVSSERIELCNVPVPRSGALRIAIRQGGVTSSGKTLQTYAWSKWQIVLWSLGVVVLGGVLVSALMHAQPAYRINKNKYGLFRALFLDPETDTYSLSKYQFYAWTAAALFSYSYLAFSKMLVQNASLPDVPGTLPGVIALGAGTSIGAQVVTSVRGPKGAGEEYPSLADFVTSGGVAAPERVQMLLWTTFGVFAFCIAASQPRPADIQGLPQVPDALLYLMGLSAAGYLGGKLARKPGPVIDELSVTPPEPDDLATAAAPTLPAAADFDQPIAAAQQILVALKPASERLHSAAPGLKAVAAAKAAVSALQSSIAAATDPRSKGDLRGLLEKAAQNRAAAEDAAAQAAAEFDKIAGSHPPDPGGDAAREAAELAQRAAAAAQSLASGLSQAINISEAGTSAPRHAGSLPPERIIEVRGRNLSTDATFTISGGELPFSMLTRADGGHRPEMVARDEDSGLANMGSQIRLRILPGTLSDVDLERYRRWFGTRQSDLRFSLINPDGQKSVIAFSLPPGAVQARTPEPQPKPAPAKPDGGRS